MTTEGLMCLSVERKDRNWTDGEVTELQRCLGADALIRPDNQRKLVFTLAEEFPAEESIGLSFPGNAFEVHWDDDPSALATAKQ